MHKLKVLLVEDMIHEQIVIKSKLSKSLPEKIVPDFHVVDHAEAALEAVKRKAFDLVILDIDFSQSEASRGMTGLEASKKIKILQPETYSVIVSSTEEESTMNEAIEKFDADWYLRRSSVSFDELAWIARQALLSRLHREGLLVENRYRFLTENPAAKRILRRVEGILPHQNTLIYGETGTGKELIARRIHANAKAFDENRPLKVLDCSALSPQLFESELFGHKKGSFTGAMSDRAGALQLVNGGDLFLDEIHNIPLHLQQKLLRVLNDGVFSPIGSNLEIKSRFRVIAATNVPLEESLSSGKLLPDFVERIRRIEIRLLPLRERPEDIRPLTESYLDSLSSFDKEFSEDAISYLKALPWRGNIRELKGFLDRILAEVKVPVIRASHLEGISNIPISKTYAASLPVSAEEIFSSFADRLIQEEIPLAMAINAVESAYLTKSIGRTESIRDLSLLSGYNRRTLTKRLQELGLFGGR